jgi:hypothetical protein
MTTTREYTAAQPGPVMFEATTVAAHLSVFVEDRPAALVTVTTTEDTGPAADAVRTVTFEGDPGYVSVVLSEPARGRESTVINRHSETTVNHIGGNAVVGAVIGTVVFGNVNVVDGGMVIGHVPVTSAPISIEARLPLGSSLACETASGAVGTRGDLANVTVTTVSGDIHLDGAHTPHLRTTSGDVRVDRLTGTQASARTVSGDIRITADTASARVRARSVSGDIRVTGPDIDLEARTVSGRVTTR